MNLQLDHFTSNRDGFEYNHGFVKHETKIVLFSTHKGIDEMTLKINQGLTNHGIDGAVTPDDIVPMSEKDKKAFFENYLNT